MMIKGISAKLVFFVESLLLLNAMSCSEGSLYLSGGEARQDQAVADAQSQAEIEQTSKSSSTYKTPISDGQVPAPNLKTSNEPVDISGTFLTAGYIKHSDDGSEVSIGLGIYCDKELQIKTCDQADKFRAALSVTPYVVRKLGANPEITKVQQSSSSSQIDPRFDLVVTVPKDEAYYTYLLADLGGFGRSMVAVNNPFILPEPGTSFKLFYAAAGIPTAAGLVGAGSYLTTENLPVVDNSARCNNIDNDWVTAYRNGDGLVMQRDNGHCNNCTFIKPEVKNFVANSPYAELKVSDQEVLGIVLGSEGELSNLNDNFCNQKFADNESEKLRCKNGGHPDAPLFLRVKQKTPGSDPEGHNQFVMDEGRLVSRSDYVVCQAEPHTNFDTAERDYLIAFPRRKLSDKTYAHFCAQATITYDTRTDAEKIQNKPEIWAQCPAKLDAFKRFYAIVDELVAK